MANKWRQALVLWGVNNSTYQFPNLDTRLMRMYELKNNAKNRWTIKRWKPRQAIPDTSNLPSEKWENFTDKNWKIISIRYWKDDKWNPSFFARERVQSPDGNYTWLEYDPFEAEWNNYEIYNNIRGAKKNEDWSIDYSFKDEIFWRKYNMPANAK